MRTLKNLINSVFLVLGYIFPRSKRKIVFGAWDGNSYSDNPKFLFEYFFAHPEWRIVWIGRKGVERTLPDLPPYASFARRHSIIGMWHALTAGTWVFSHCPNDISLVAVWGRALLVDVCHGAAIKRVGAVCASYRENHCTMEKLWRKFFSCKIYLGMPSNRQGIEAFKGYPGMFQYPILPFGATAFDYILKNRANRELARRLKLRFAADYSLPVDKNWIVYAPTFRWTTEKNFSFRELGKIEYHRICQILERKNYIIVEKLHPRRVGDLKTSSHDCIYSISGHKAMSIEPYDLWIAADAMISDYSGCVVPMFLQNKPVIHFVYDYDYFMNKDAGLIADIDDVRFGVVAHNVDELCAAIENIEFAAGQSGVLAPSLIEYVKGNACEQYEAFIRSKHNL